MADLTSARFTGNLAGAALPVGILAVVAMMVLPLPLALLDIFFVFNILLALLVLMVSLHSYRPLDFSSFPSVLLIATVLRLALNVASTRIVLTDGHNGPGAAGKVIEAFGNFVIAGNFAVGLVVFIILMIINLVVITKGAGRVSEVSARFTLDAMPGKQMAIDADMNAGILTPEQARARAALKLRKKRIFTVPWMVHRNSSKVTRLRASLFLPPISSVGSLSAPASTGSGWGRRRKPMCSCPSGMVLSRRYRRFFCP